MNKLLIVGAGGHGRVCFDIATQMNQWSEVFFLDDGPKQNEYGLKIVDRVENASSYSNEYDFFVAIGDNEIRENIIQHFEMKKLNVINLIHPNSVISGDISIGKGTVIMPGSIINTGTKIGRGVIINTGAIIDHDCTICDYVHISPGVNLAGNVYIHDNSHIGIGASVINNISIEAEVIVGAGAVIVKKITSSGLYIGTPARKVENL